MLSLDGVLEGEIKIIAPGPRMFSADQETHQHSPFSIEKVLAALVLEAGFWLTLGPELR